MKTYEDVLLDIEYHDKQLDAMAALDPESGVEEVVYGGAKNGGKSYLGVSWVFGSALMYADTGWFIARKELNDLRKHTQPTIHEYFKKLGLKLETYAKWNGQDNYYQLYNGSKVFLLDCKYLPSDEMYERFGSMQFTGGWIEEAGEIPYQAYENIKLSIGRWNNDAVYSTDGKELLRCELPFKLLITCNPKKNWLYTDFYKPWSKKTLEKRKCFIKALVTDNTFRQKGSLEVLDRIKSKTTKMRLRYGEWEYADDPDALMDYDSIISIFSNSHVKAEGHKYMTVDVARFGKDKTKIRIWHGWRIIKYVALEKASTKETAEKINELRIKHTVPLTNIIVDEDGIGGGVVDQLPKGVVGFIANSTPIDLREGESYKNLKAQCAYALAVQVNKKGIYEEVDDIETQDTLTQDLEWIKEADVDSDGKRNIMSKKLVKAAIGRSPDDGDSYIMRMYFELKRKVILKLK